MPGWCFAKPQEGVTGRWWVHLDRRGARLLPRCCNTFTSHPMSAEAPPSPLFRACSFNLGRGWDWGVNKVEDSRDVEKKVGEQRKG